MNSWFGVSPISASHRFATPSPHRTGVPISDRFSIKRTSAPPRAAYFAAVLPVGPAPTTSTSIWWSIRVGPIPSDFMRIWESLFSNARCGGPQGPLSSGLRRSAVMLAPSRTAYVFVCVSTYTAHGAGNPEGPETRVLESRGLPPKRLGGVQRHSAGCPREPGDRGLRRADALPHRWSAPTAALFDVAHGEARARCDRWRRKGKHRGGRADGARGRPPVLARRAAAAPRGPEPNDLGTDWGHGAAAPPRGSRRHGRPGERGRPVGRIGRGGRSIPEAEPTDPEGIREDDRQPEGEN